MKIAIEFVGEFMWIGVWSFISIFVGPMFVNKVLGGEKAVCQLDYKFSFRNLLQVMATITILLFAIIILCIVVK